MTIAENINHLRQQLEPNPQVTLMAVSKQQTTAAISEAYEAGIVDFGENYWQEAQPKINQLAHLPLCWHFIGPIQSNKAKGIAEHFDWVHSVDRISIAVALNKFRPIHLPELNLCLQVSLVNEANKGGIAPTAVAELVKSIQSLPRLRLRGLMTIPPPKKNDEEQFHLFYQLTQLLNELNQQLKLNMDTLSMGMSDDWQVAIKAGATMIRIGQTIFGPRRKQ